jgi:hypothetical protein
MNSYHFPKIIILGIDALEYDLVKEWRLKNIMQKSYCKMDLSDYSVIITPVIWGSMLTGKIDEEILKIWEKTAEIVGFPSIKQKWWKKIGTKILPHKIKKWIWNNYYEKQLGGNPFDTSANYINDKKERNIFQFFEKTWTNGIPGFGKNVSSKIKKKYMRKAIQGEKTPFIDLVLKNYREDKNKLLSAINNKEFDFIFWYTNLLDSLGHLEISKPIAMMKYYFEINELVGRVKESCPKSKIYVISDHGMERMKQQKTRWGMHSKHAFFSSNTGEKIEKPIQLYDLVYNNRSFVKFDS